MKAIWPAGRVRRHFAAGGFTLVEMLVVTGLMAVLAMAALPMAEITSARAKEQELRLALREIRAAIDAYKRFSDEASLPASRQGSGYPPQLATLTEGAVDLRRAVQHLHAALFRDRCKVEKLRRQQE